MSYERQPIANASTIKFPQVFPVITQAVSDDGMVFTVFKNYFIKCNIFSIVTVTDFFITYLHYTLMLPLYCLNFTFSFKQRAIFFSEIYSFLYELNSIVV